MSTNLDTNLFNAYDQSTWPEPGMPVLVFVRERGHWEQMSFRMDGPHVVWSDAHGDYDDGLDDEDVTIRWAEVPADPFEAQP